MRLFHLFARIHVRRRHVRRRLRLIKNFSPSAADDDPKVRAACGKVKSLKRRRRRRRRRRRYRHTYRNNRTEITDGQQTDRPAKSIVFLTIKYRAGVVATHRRRHEKLRLRRTPTAKRLPHISSFMSVLCSSASARPSKTRRCTFRGANGI